MRIRCAFIFLLMLLLFAVPASADFVLPADLTEIGEEAFANDESITGVLEIPEGVTSIGAGAFQGCGGILSVVIPEGVSFIGENAFGDCAEMTGYITSIETSAFLSDVTVQLREGDLLIAETTTDQNGYYSLIVQPGEYTLHAIHVNCEEKTASIAILPKTPVQQDMALPIAVTAAENFTWEIVNTNEVAITGYVGSSNLMRIPETIDGMTVTTIKQAAFANNEVIEVVVMPDCITTIGCGAFEYCPNLMYSNIPVNWTTTTEFGHIWRGCSKLLSITVPEGMTILPSYAFWYCENFQTINLPTTLEVIGTSAFGQTRIKQITLPNNLINIGNEAFARCYDLQSIEFPVGLQRIGHYAFVSCNSLTHIELPDGLTTMGYRVFLWCSNLESTTIPKNWTTIEESRWHGGHIWEGTKITKIVVPEGVVKLPDYAFDGCSTLTDISLPSTLEVIGTGAFVNCSSLSTITLPESVHTINASSFEGCSSLAYIKLPNSVSTIPTAIFKKCSKLKQIDFSSNVSFIGSYAFEECTNLSDFCWPDTVSEIGSGTFLNCSSLKSITIPKTVKRIRYSAFQGCTSLTSIEIPANMTALENGIFKGCTNLSSITLPQSLTVIGNEVFANCTSLSGVLEIPDTVTSIGTAAFQNCTGLGGELDLPDSLVTIGNNAFENCTGLQGDLVIPDSVTTIGSYAFANCSDLTNVKFSPNIISIGEYAFKNCTQLIGTHFFEDNATIAETAFTDSPGFSQYRQSDKNEYRQYSEELILKFMESYIAAPEELLGVLKADASDTWYNYLVNAAVDIVNLNFDDFNVILNKEEYLFAKALDFADRGTAPKLANVDCLPSELKELNSDIITNKDIFFNSLVILGKDQFGNQVNNQSFKDLFEQYRKGEIDKSQYETGLTFCGIDAGYIADVVGLSDWLSELSMINDLTSTLSDIEKKVNGPINLWNQWQLVNALDFDTMRETARIYKQSDDLVVVGVGYKMEAMANADPAGRILLLASGDFIHAKLDELVNTALKKAVTGSLSAGFMATVTITNTIINGFTGVNELPQLTHELRFSADATRSAYKVFQKDLEAYRTNPSEETFRTAYWDYFIYLSVASQSQDAFVALYDQVDNSLVGGIAISDEQRGLTDWVRQQSIDLTRFAEDARALFGLYETGDVVAFRQRIEEIRKETYTTPFSGGGGEGGGDGGGGGR